MADTNITGALYQKGALMALKVGRWTGIKKIRKHDLLRDEVDESAYHMGHKKLLPPKSDETLQKLETEARKFVSSRSLPFLGMDGVRFVKFSELQNVLEELPKLREKFQAAVEELVKAYPEFKRKQLEILNEQAQRITLEELKKVEHLSADVKAEKKKELEGWLETQEDQNEAMYPTPDYLRSRFYIEWKVFQLTPHPDIGESFNSLETDLKAWVKEAMADNHQVLGIIARNALKVYENQEKKFTVKNLRPIYEGCRSFLAGDFAEGTLTPAKDAAIWLLNRFETGSGAGVPKYDWFLKEVVTDEGLMAKVLEKLTLLSGLAEESSAEKAAVACLKEAGELTRALDW